MPLPSTHGASASPFPSFSPRSVYNQTRMRTRIPPSIRPNLNPGLSRAPNRVHPLRPQHHSSSREEHARAQAYRRAVGHVPVSSMGPVARLASHGVFSRYAGHPIRIRGRCVPSFRALSACPRHSCVRLCGRYGLAQSFLTLPGANTLSFVDVGAVDLSSLLPNLPPSTSSMPLDTNTHTPAPDPVPSPLDLVHRFLVYEPARRLHSSEALCHPWFAAEPGLVLPIDDRTEHPLWTGAVTHTFTLEGITRSLGDLLQMYVTSKA